MLAVALGLAQFILDLAQFGQQGTGLTIHQHYSFCRVAYNAPVA
ncbi:MAG: hypothetical protein ACI82H_000222 [Alphaproteobacteria bacterium]|jgi:hypothetical protein